MKDPVAVDPSELFHFPGCGKGRLAAKGVMWFRLSLLVLIIFSCTSCEKDPVRPEPTQHGANMLYFEAEGLSWVPTDNSFAWNQEVGELAQQRFSLSAAMESNEGDVAYLDIDADSVNAVEEIRCRQIRSLSYERENGSGICFACGDQETSFQITKLDTVAKIISGTFSFKARCGDSSIVEVTNGWFDYQYPYFDG